jgi:hypothetical protein
MFYLKNYFQMNYQTKMDTVIAESTQQLLLPGKCVDLYYPDPETAKKQCFRTSQNSKYLQAFANTGAGTSVFTIPPSNGVQDILVILRLPDLTGLSAGLGVNRGWGYSAIRQISYRIGGSSQYFLSGDQVLQNALRQCPNAQARDDLFALGGAELTGAGLNSANNYAYVWLSLPFTKPSSAGKPVPLPSDLLTQQIQVTVELNPPSTYFSLSAGGAGTIPAQLASASFQVQQVMLHNQGDALASRVDMTTHSLSYPAEFTQQEVIIPLANSAGVQTVSLTGFRSGEVKGLQVWLSRDVDATGAGGIKQTNRWYQPTDLQVTYAGDVYARYDAGSSVLWNLVNSRMTPKFANSLLVTNGAGGYNASTPYDSYWVDLPFSQSYDPDTAHSMYVAGKEISNGIVQLQLRTPSAQADWKLHVSYVYNTVIVFSQGTCDYAF